MRQIIELSHAFNLCKLDKITVLVRVSLVLVDVHRWILTLLNAADNELFRCFSILVCHEEFSAVVQEGITGQTHVLGENEANFVLSAEIVDLHKSITVPEELSDANNIKLVNHVIAELVCDLDIHMRVKLLKLAYRCLSSCLVANIALTDVEVGTHVRDAHLSWVIDRDRVGSGEDQILCDFNSEATHTNNENFHLDELAHRFEAESTNLSRVEIGVDLGFLWCWLYHLDCWFSWFFFLG